MLVTKIFVGYVLNRGQLRIKEYNFSYSAGILEHDAMILYIFIIAGQELFFLA